jgi:nitric oxide reductase subunit C
MLSKSAARRFFLVGTALCFGAFILLTVDTLGRIPEQTNQQELSESAIRGKHLWDRSNCMGCHTLLGEGAYYAPELTRVHSRRGPVFIESMLRDPQAMYPGRRKMWQYDFSDQERQDLIAFFAWVDRMDLNGFPAAPNLLQVAGADVSGDAASRYPLAFQQICVACHKLEGQGGVVGPALDGVADRMTPETLRKHLKDPKSVKPDSLMPQLPLDEATIEELVAFLSTLKASSTRGAR